MKKIIFLFGFILVSAITINAQNYVPVIDTGKLWSVKSYESGDYYPWFDTYFYKFSSDTIINGKNYTKILSSLYKHDDTFDISLKYWSLCCFIREKDKRIYIRSISGKEGKIYDFNLNLNDTVYINNVQLLGDSVMRIVQNEDSVLLAGKYYHRYLLKSTRAPIYDEYWIESIGSLRGLIYSGFELIGWGYQLLCFSLNDTMIYHNPDHTDCYYMHTGIPSFNPSSINLQIYPDPVSDFLSIEYSGTNENLTIEILNIFRQVVISKRFENSKLEKYIIDLSNLKDGIYIFQLKTKDKIFTKKIIKK